MKQTIRLLLMLAIALTLPACGAGSAIEDLFAGSGNAGAESNTPPAGTPMTDGERGLAQQVLDRLNAERQQAGVPPLQWHEPAALVAQDHNLDMRRRGFFGHDNPDGENPGDRLARAGVEVRSWGENIARGQDSAGEVMDDWMNSPGHRDNILYDGFTHVGIGVLNLPGGPWWTQVFVTE